LTGVPLFTLEQVLAQANIILVLVAHRQFKELPRESLAGKLVLDTCGAWRG
jgi:UDP-N-acetyl-D-mannosaminuronic acid dehydrogenase